MRESDRLAWLCRRGMREVEDILQKTLNNIYGKFDLHLQKKFFKLLAYSDIELYDWLVLKKNTYPLRFDCLIAIITNTYLNSNPMEDKFPIEAGIQTFNKKQN